MEQEYYTLSQLSTFVHQAVTTCLPDTFWVKAEIAQITTQGHCYMELVEKGDEDIIVAKMRATCWRDRYVLLALYFEQETGRSMQAGMEVMVEVEVMYHAVYGLSLNITDIDPTFSIGTIAKQRIETLRRLEQDGVMELQKMLPLPILPKRIAVVSSADAAGWGDFHDQLDNNRYHYPFVTRLFASSVQGDKAVGSIIEALNTIAQTADQWDIVVIIRGGGSTTDLSCFDDYDLASHCAQFPLPIIAGIGHTRDISVVDMVVHCSVKTPTAAAEWLLAKVETQLTRLEQLGQRILMITRTVRLREENRLNMLEQAIRLHSPERIFKMGYSVTTVNGRVIRSTTDVTTADHITTALIDGQIHSTVE